MPAYHANPFMLASSASASTADYRKLGADWTFDLKLDGIRACVMFDGDTATILGRTTGNPDITDRYPELAATARLHVGNALGYCIDGEIVAQDGTFATAAKRHKQPADAVAKSMRELAIRFVAFDITDHDGKSVINLPWTQRRALLESMLVLSQFWGLSVVSKSVEFVETVKSMGAEGVIAKLNSSVYMPGVRGAQWIKYKNKHRVFAMVRSVTKGQGARERLGALELCLINPEGAYVPIGKCGSGMTESEITAILATLDGTTHWPVVEIECLGISKSGILRQPVFKNMLERPYSTTIEQLTSVHQLHDIPTY